MNISHEDEHSLITYYLQNLAMSALCADIVSAICNYFSAQGERIGLGTFHVTDVLRK